MNKILLFLLTTLGRLTWADLDFEKLCSGKRLNEVVAHPQDCRGYILCSEQPAEHYCEVGLHFDIKNLVCNWPENVNCQLPSQNVEDIKVAVKPVLTSLMALDIMTGEVVDPMISYDPLNVVCRHFGAYFLPNPNQCRSYYLCAYGHMHEHACGPNTLWDFKNQQCVLNHKALCYDLAPEEENEIQESLANNMENDDFICYPVNTTTTAASLYPTSANHSRPIPTPPTILQPSSKRPNISNPFNITCPAKRQSYVAHPKDCSKYYICIMGTAVMTSCPRGLLWDSKKEYCDLSKNVKCFQEKKYFKKEITI